MDFLIWLVKFSKTTKSVLFFKIYFLSFILNNFDHTKLKLDKTLILYFFDLIKSFNLEIIIEKKYFKLAQ